MNEFYSPALHGFPDFRGRRETQTAARNQMNVNSCGVRASGQHRIFCRDQFRRMASLIEALQKKQQLALATAPFGFEVHEKGNHAAPSFAVPLCLDFRSASTSSPSFANFIRTPRAAIWAMTAPR